MNYIAQCLDRFRELPTETRDSVGGVESLKAIRKMEEEYGVDLSFSVILVAINELSLDTLADYLTEKYSFSEEDANDIVDGLIEGVFSRLVDDNNLLSKEEIEAVFSGSLLSLFDDKEKIELVNYSIFSLLAQDGSVINSFGKCLLENSTELTGGKLILEQKKVEPTVGNWLLDFIKLYGSDVFDDLSLAEYLSKSDNAKILSEQDKKNLSRAIKTYRNVFFFLDVTEGKQAAAWEIIPVEETVNRKTGGEYSLARENTPTHSKFGDPIREELEESLRSFQKGSLEYRATSEELERLNKAVKKS
ncbi:MAG: hypothetical protein NT165_04060 [Candidatus Falkowbacteria bacterium]|nr:hypothetical protein [Candidatus Falkowbacteria bacterium]